MAGDFLKGLPSFNKENFARFNTEGQTKTTAKKPAVYLQTKDTTNGDSQVIVTDKTNILLRYLRQQQLEIKNSHPKRSQLPTDSASPARKVPRMETSSYSRNLHDDE